MFFYYFIVVIVVVVVCGLRMGVEVTCRWMFWMEGKGPSWKMAVGDGPRQIHYWGWTGGACSHVHVESRNELFDSIGIEN